MTPNEIVRYAEVTMDASYRAGRVDCFVCKNVLATGDRCLLIPSDIEQQRKLDAREPYDSLLAHRACIERML
jgi:hypothetical protein